MPDTVLNSVVLVEVVAGAGETAYFTNAGYSLTYDGIEYVPSSAFEITPDDLTGDFTTSEYTLSKVDASIGVLPRLAINVPYATVTVEVKELFFDEDGAVSGFKWLKKGLVYQVKHRPAVGEMDIILKDYKYYLDTTAGVVCTEQCSAPFFGDPYVCKKTVQSEAHVIESIAGFNVTTTLDPTLTTPFLFNNGYMELGGSRVRIQYHESGRTFEMARPVPAYWAGELVTIYTGCDKRLETCRDIHNNEVRFFGLGYSMVDYNPLYENP